MHRPPGRVILNLNITNVMITFKLLHSHELLIQARALEGELDARMLEE